MALNREQVADLLLEEFWGRIAHQKRKWYVVESDGTLTHRSVPWILVRMLDPFLVDKGLAYWANLRNIYHLLASRQNGFAVSSLHTK